nr:hypothetical protein [Bifidobacterium dentium]
MAPIALAMRQRILPLPQLGDNVDIGVGASIIGNVIIADGTLIGAGAVVTRSVLDKNTIIAGIPAKPLH